MLKRNTFNLKRVLLFIVLLTATILWTYVIFGFSSAVGEQSASQSHKVTQGIIRLFDSEYDMPEFPDEGSSDKVYDVLVRKTAHVSEYAILAVLSYLTVFCVVGTKRNKFFPCLFSSTFCVLAASCDEINQYFTDGRTGCFRDVAIDSIGIAIGSILCGVVVFHIIQKRRERKTNLK